MLPTACGNQSVEGRYLVSLIIKTARDYLDGQHTVLLGHEDQRVLMCLPDSLLAIAVDLGVDLKGEPWTGDALVDTNTLFGKIVTCLADIVLDFTHQDYGKAVAAAGSMLDNYRREGIPKRMLCQANTSLRSSAKRKRCEMEAGFVTETKGADEVSSEDEVEDLIECSASPASESDDQDYDHPTYASPHLVEAAKLQALIASDRYRDSVQMAKMCAHFLSEHFFCDITATTFEARPTPVPDLTTFIYHVLWRADLPSSHVFYALCLLARFNARYEAGDGFGHGMFMAAYTVASKMLIDYAPPNRYWRRVGYDVLGQEEMNAMEYALCDMLEWDLIIDNEELEAFEAWVRKWHGPRGAEAAAAVAPAAVDEDEGEDEDIERVEAEVNDDAGFEADDEGEDEDEEEDEDEWEEDGDEGEDEDEDEEEMAWVEDEITVAL